MTTFHQQYPIYLTPTTATTAPLNSDPAFLPADVAKLLQIKDLNFKDQMNLIYAAWLHGLSKTPFTQLANVAGEPALSLPTYVSAAGLPLGIQLEGAPGSDLVLLALGKLFEDHHQFRFLNDYRAQVLPPKQAANPQATAPTKKAGATGGQLANNRMVAGSQLASTGSHKTREVSALQPELPQTGSQHSTILVALGIGSLLALLAVDTEGRHKQR